ncbi:MAG TPA: hypothetical protein VEZ72_00240 [Paenibacillus sp.]|nr:hypothetical protein [Paenibacillus sp.]
MMHRSKIASKAKTLVGHPVAVKMKDGATVAGTLVRMSGDRLYVRTQAVGDAKRTTASHSVRTKALLPLLLYDVAALGAGPYGGYGAYGPYGPYGGPYGPYGPYGGAGGFWF